MQPTHASSQDESMPQEKINRVIGFIEVFQSLLLKDNQTPITNAAASGILSVIKNLLLDQQIQVTDELSLYADLLENNESNTPTLDLLGKILGIEPENNQEEAKVAAAAAALAEDQKVADAAAAVQDEVGLAQQATENDVDDELAALLAPVGSGPDSGKNSSATITDAELYALLGLDSTSDAGPEAADAEEEAKKAADDAAAAALAEEEAKKAAAAAAAKKAADDAAAAAAAKKAADDAAAAAAALAEEEAKNAPGAAAVGSAPKPKSKVATLAKLFTQGTSTTGTFTSGGSKPTGSSSTGTGNNDADAKKDDAVSPITSSTAPAPAAAASSSAPAAAASSAAAAEEVPEGYLADARAPIEKVRAALTAYFASNSAGINNALEEYYISNNKEQLNNALGMVLNVNSKGYVQKDIDAIVAAAVDARALYIK